MKLPTTLFGVRDSLPTARESNVFRSVCQSFCPQVGGGGLPLGSLHPGGLPRGESSSRGVGTHPIGIHSCSTLKILIKAIMYSLEVFVTGGYGF